MKKIWILRERMDWHNCDADDCTTAYHSEIAAKRALIETIEETQRLLEANGYELVDGMTKYEVDRGRIVTTSDDYYNCWIEEIEYYSNE